MEKEKVPTLKPYDGCQHRLTLPLYARGDSWTSTQKITGKMIYICTKCGALLDRGFIKREDKLKTTESYSAGDAFEKKGDGDKNDN